MELIAEKVRQFTQPNYDINVWADNEGQLDASWTINLTFYPLIYPSDPEYQEHYEGFPAVNMSVFHTLRIPIVHRGNRIAEALAYLDNLVTNSCEEGDEFDLQSMNWWSSETVLNNPPEFIADFIETLPRKGN